MAQIERKTAEVFYAPTARRRYFSAVSAAKAEARAMLENKYPTEKGDESDGYYNWHWSADPRLVEVHNRLVARIKRSLLRKRK